MSKFAVALVAAVLAGCATTRPQLTRDEWLATTSRTYEGVSKEQVIGAAERLFRLADGDDFNIAHNDDGIYASRNWTAYVVIAAAMGIDYWQLSVTPAGAGVKVRVQVNTQAQGVTPMATTNGAWTATTTAMAGSPVMGTAIYDAFWSRMDYLLGKRPDWMTCQIADERVKQKVTWGSNEALCNSFNLKDDVPTGPSVSNPALQGTLRLSAARP